MHLPNKYPTKDGWLAFGSVFGPKLVQLFSGTGSGYLLISRVGEPISVLLSIPVKDVLI
jgi:hypothetical protein